MDGSGTPMRRWSRGNRGRGATAVEYALMVALVVAVIVVLVATVGRQVFDLYHTVPTF
jgi:Flp pilus assembly pilin Flp